MGSTMGRLFEPVRHVPPPVTPPPVEAVQPVPTVPEAQSVTKRFAGPPSPHDLIQERYSNDPWKVIVCCIMLNCTSRGQLDKVIEGFFERWPGPKELLDEDPDVLAEAVKSCGFKNRRVERLRRMSEGYGALGPEPTLEGIESLHGVGEYAARAVGIFCYGVPGEEEPEDGPLTKYWKWCRENPEEYEKGWS